MLLKVEQIQTHTQPHAFDSFNVLFPSSEVQTWRALRHFLPTTIRQTTHYSTASSRSEPQL